MLSIRGHRCEAIIELENAYKDDWRARDSFAAFIRGLKNYKHCSFCYERIGRKAHQRAVNALAQNTLKKLGL